MKNILYKLSCLLTMVFLILFSVFTVVNTNGFYTSQYIKNNTEKRTGISVDNLNDITQMLLDYLKDNRDDLDMQVAKNGYVKEVFDLREKTHMVDVKNLYTGAKRVMYICAVTSVATLFLLYIKDEKQNFIKEVIIGYKFTAVIFIALCVVLGLVFTVGFNWFWTNFHKVFFTNDLWLLDPKVSTMINMFPLEFFLAMCTKILLRFAILFILVYPVLKLLKSKITVTV